MSALIFHSMADSAYLWTAIQVADEKAVAYDIVPLIYRSPEHLALQPFGKMPVLQHGDRFIYETLAIAHYIDKAFDGPALQPSTAFEQAEVLRWISIVNAYVFPTMNRFMKESIVRPLFGFEPDAAFIEASKAPLALQVKLIDDAVARTRFVAGDTLTIADSFLLPHLLFFGLTAEGESLLASAPAATAWLDRMKARPSYRDGPMCRAYQVMLERGAQGRGHALNSGGI